MRIKPDDAVVRSDHDLYRLWLQLMGPGGYGVRTLWLLFLDSAGRPAGVIIPIEDIPAEPDPKLIGSLAPILDDVGLPADSSVALLLSRPGSSAMSAQDRRWARALRTGLGAIQGRWPVHLATRDRLQVFAPDDLIAVS